MSYGSRNAIDEVSVDPVQGNSQSADPDHPSDSLAERDFLQAEPDDELESDIDRSRGDESLIEKLRIVLWAQHQSYIAWLLAICLVGMSAYFVSHAITNEGLIDIDNVESFNAEFKVDINSAELGEIVVLPGVGPKLGQAIIERRDSVGRYGSLDGLQDVPGIGEKKLAAIRPYLLPIPVELER